MQSGVRQLLLKQQLSVGAFQHGQARCLTHTRQQSVVRVQQSAAVGQSLVSPGVSRERYACWPIGLILIKTRQHMALLMNDLRLGHLRGCPHGAGNAFLTGTGSGCSSPGTCQQLAHQMLDLRPLRGAHTLKLSSRPQRACNSL